MTNSIHTDLYPIPNMDNKLNVRFFRLFSGYCVLFSEFFIMDILDKDGYGNREN